MSHMGGDPRCALEWSVYCNYNNAGNTPICVSSLDASSALRTGLACVLHCVAARHAIVPQRIASSQQIPSIAVQRRVRCCMRHERQDGSTHTLQRPSG